jgi:type IV pilus assembly protein PilA
VIVSRKGDQLKDEFGFTLIELLVVVLIIAILAAIAIPAFLKQRERAYMADITAALKEGSTAAEAWATGHDGDYAGLDGDTGPLLESEGYRASTAVSILVEADGTSYCLTAMYSLLPGGHEWQTATYDIDEGKPTEADTC